MHLKPITASLRFDMLFPALAVAFVGGSIATPLWEWAGWRQ
jgi:hypothetical protein